MSIKVRVYREETNTIYAENNSTTTTEKTLYEQEFHPLSDSPKYALSITDTDNEKTEQVWLTRLILFLNEGVKSSVVLVSNERVSNSIEDFFKLLQQEREPVPVKKETKTRKKK